jgi:hypothetical protein
MPMAFNGWEKTEIETDQGGAQRGIAPLIISASRSTDIPAFYSDWFANRLKAGYCKWINPFNRKPQYVSLEKARFIVFWSKNPAPMIPYLDMLDARDIGWYFQFTVNDYEAEGFEPNVPKLDERIETFQMLSERAGKERLIWRFDPLILADRLQPADLLKKVEDIGNQIHSHTEKLVISFADISNYAKVKRNLGAGGVNWQEFSPEAIEEIAAGVSSLAEGWGLEVATCGERVDLEKYGIAHNRCIDDELMMRISGSDRNLATFLGYGNNLTLFGGSKATGQHPLKDKGQRKECGCIVSKDIGQYNTCEHLCIYCYANTSAQIVQKNRNLVSPQSEAIIAE